jgi:hypothetical protein
MFARYNCSAIWYTPSLRLVFFQLAFAKVIKKADNVVLSGLEGPY